MEILAILIGGAGNSLQFILFGVDSPLIFSSPTDATFKLSLPV
jgi:hypothetical protein